MEKKNRHIWKIGIFLLLVITALQLFGTSALAGECETWGNLTWTLNSNDPWLISETLTISGSGDMDDLNVYYDDFYEEYLRDAWLKNYETITKVIITNGVTSIGAKAFYDLSLLENIIIPDSVTSIGNEAFCFCDSLSDITIPNSVTSIGDRAFVGCSNLTNITIPNSVTSIGVDAFVGCSSLTSINVDTNNSMFSSEDGVLYNKAKTMLYLCPKNITSFTIPNGVTSIGESAFSGCSSLTSITIPNSVTSIGEGALSGCSSLASITIPNSVTSIGEGAFYCCSSLTNITIPNSVTSIGEDAFSGCESLTSITVASGNNQYSSYEGTLYNKSKTKLLCCPCGKEGEYIISDGVTSIEQGAFKGCEFLTTVTIPSSLISDLDEIFTHCEKLETITVASGNSKYSSYGGVLYNKSRTKLLRCPCGKKGRYKIPDGVTVIENRAFYGCDLYYILIPYTVTSIEYDGLVKSYDFCDDPEWGFFEYYDSCAAYIFYEGTETEWNEINNSWVDEDTLVYIINILELPSETKTIGAESFSGVKNVTIKVPAGVTFISEKAFGNKVLIWCKSGSYAMDRCIELGLPYATY